MNYHTLVASFAATLVLGQTLGAQSIAVFGSAEAAGLGESSELLGVSVSGSRPGLVPVGTLVGQTYRYASGLGTFASAEALSPSVGLKENLTSGSVQAEVGYSVVHTSTPVPVVGVVTGSSNGAFVIGQGNYWGDGSNVAQVIASYGFGSEYYWTRLRAAHRIAPTSTPVYVGAEVVLQGTDKSNQSEWRYQVGPTVEYRFSPGFRVGVAGGYRGAHNDGAGSGYVRIEFLALTTM